MYVCVIYSMHACTHICTCTQTSSMSLLSLTEWDCSQHKLISASVQPTICCPLSTLGLWWPQSPHPILSTGSSTHLSSPKIHIPLRHRAIPNICPHLPHTCFWRHGVHIPPAVTRIWLVDDKEVTALTQLHHWPTPASNISRRPCPSTRTNGPST